MDVAVLLLLPLVGGYAFSKSCNVTRYLVAREEGHRLYFRAAFWGVALFFIALLARLWLIAESASYRGMEDSVRDLVSPYIKDSSKGTAFQLTIVALEAMALGVPLGSLLNLLFWKGPFLASAIQHDYLETLLNRAVTESIPIAVTMKSRKVYVGFVLQTLDPVKERKWITILPLVSGYRDQKDLRLIFVTNYRDVYGNVDPATGDVRLPKPLDHMAARDFEITFPVDEVQSVSLFDLTAYKAFATGHGS